MSEQQSDWQPDAITEPPNSTVDDWMGQRVARDEERADAAVREAGGDLDEAERNFDAETDARDPLPSHDSRYGERQPSDRRAAQSEAEAAERLERHNEPAGDTAAVRGAGDPDDESVGREADVSSGEPGDAGS